MVVVYHYFENSWVTVPGTWAAGIQAAIGLGWTGVDLFFVLSGFLIGGILLDARLTKNYFEVFYKRRFFRIIPLYFAALVVFPALYVAIQHAGRANDFAWLAGGRQQVPWLCYLTFTQNFWMANTEKFGSMMLAITWSLAIEEQFYITLPFIIRLLTGTQVTKVVRFGIYLAPLIRLGLGFLFHHNWIALFVLMPCRMDALLLGVLAAIMMRDERQKRWIQSKYVGVLACALALGMAAFTILTPTPDNPVMQSFGYTLVALFYTSVLVYAVTRTDSVLSRLLRLKWLGWLGGLAYGVYLIHQTVNGLLFGLVWKREPFIEGGFSLLTTLAAIVLTLMVAQLSWRYFEAPLIKTFRSEYRVSAG